MRDELFANPKPIIGVIHVAALPGAPANTLPVSEIIAQAIREVAIYRDCGVDPAIIFTSARFRGTRAAPEAIRARMTEVQTHRETAQPIREKTGGSTFQNPPGNSAWKLIDAAGCRGLRRGDAQVSELHCNFLINLGAATAAAIEALGETVRERVKETSGVTLEWEIKRIGID